MQYSRQNNTFVLLTRAVLCAATLFVLTPPAVAGAIITVDTGNHSNARDNELSLFEALNVVNGAKAGCFTDHEKGQIQNLTFVADLFLDCGNTLPIYLWNINPLGGAVLPATIQFSSSVTDVVVTGSLPAISNQLTLDGATSNGKVRLTRTAGYVGPALTITGCSGCSSNIYIRNLKIQGFTGDAITNLVNGLTDSSFTGLEIFDNGGNGIALANGGSKNPRNIIIGGPNTADRNLIYHNGGRGISITGTSTLDWTNFDTTIAGNVIGMTAANVAAGNTGDGIYLNNVRGVTVGGATSAHANTVVHNFGDGIKVAGVSANNVISRNFVGAESGGPVDRGNAGSGMTLLGGANNNSISSNFISGNNGPAGVYISGNGTNANTLLQNTIGLGVNSTLGNLGDGVLIDAAAASNVLNGNEIDWNGNNGVRMTGGASLNQLIGNYIGVKGAFNVGNTQNGVMIDAGAHHNQVGSAGAGNYIGGNGNDGVNIQGAGTSNNSVLANWIGLGETGLPRPNNSGVALLNGASTNTIGISGAGNVIASNNSAGVFIADANTNNNLIRGNYIGINAAGNSGYGNAGSGVYIAASANNNTVGGTNQGNVISGNAGQGVDISTNGNVVSGNKIGTNIAGTAALGNGSGGVRISGGAQGNFIGYLNVVSGNTGDGIKIDSNSDNNYVLGNTVGLNAAKTLKVPNSGAGVSIFNQSSGNLVGLGGTSNVIAGNGSAGIVIVDSGSDSNSIYANYIGTNELSALGLGNSGDGIYIGNGTTNNVIGDAVDAGNRNIISGNVGNGVQVAGGGTSYVTVAGNFIGTNVAGTQALPNGQAGVALIYATNVTIGGDSAAAVQCISGNTQQGIFAQGTQFLKIKGAASAQFIGNQCNPTYGSIGNGMQGILLDNTLNSMVTPYQVSDNGGAGIAVIGSSATSNLLRPIMNFGNGGLAIDLGNDGRTLNDAVDADTGPNGLLNYPVVTSIIGNTISGTACANCTVFVYQALGNPILPGSGGQSTATVGYANGSGAWSVALSGGLTPYNVTLQACQAADCLVAADANTSELSPMNSVPGSLDIDASITASKYQSLTDGLLIMRYLLGLTGTALTKGALGNTASRTDPVAIKTYLDGIRTSLDIIGNSSTDAQTDGLLIIRYLLGLRGSALISGVFIDPLGARKTAPLIETYIQSLLP